MWAFALLCISVLMFFPVMFYILGKIYTDRQMIKALTGRSSQPGITVNVVVAGDKTPHIYLGETQGHTSPGRVIDARPRRAAISAAELPPLELDYPKEKQLCGHWVEIGRGYKYCTTCSTPLGEMSKREKVNIPKRLDRRHTYRLGGPSAKRAPKLDFEPLEPGFDPDTLDLH